MNKLNQIRDQKLIYMILVTHFTFETPSNTPILMHSIVVDDERVGFVATEDHGAVGGPHIFIFPAARTRKIMEKVGWLHVNVYCPLMKALGKEYLATNCDQDDLGTINFLKRAGFLIKKITIAELKL